MEGFLMKEYANGYNIEKKLAENNLINLMRSYAEEYGIEELEKLFQSLKKEMEK